MVSFLVTFTRCHVIYDICQPSEDGRDVVIPLWILPARQTNKCQSGIEPMSRSMSMPEHCGFLIAALADSDCLRVFAGLTLRQCINNCQNYVGGVYSQYSRACCNYPEHD